MNTFTLTAAAFFIYVLSHAGTLFNSTPVYSEADITAHNDKVAAAKAEGVAEAFPRAPDPEAVLAGFQDRVDTVFRAEAGKPLVRAEKKPPLSPERGNFVRQHSLSIVAFSARPGNDPERRIRPGYPGSDGRAGCEGL